MIRALAHRLGFHEQPSRPGVWTRQDAWALAEWLRVNLYAGGIGALHKRVPEVVKVASPQQIRMFLDHYGDKSHTREPGDQFFTSSRRTL
jgi:hypothetical protein